MKFFEQAQENLKRSNFYKALELFQISLNEDALSDELKVFCCEKIEKINQILKLNTTVELLIFLAEHYFELGRYQKAQDFFGKLFLETNEISYLKKQFESMRASGDVTGSLLKSNEYLEKLYKTRLSDEIVKFIDENETLFKPVEKCSWTMRSCLLAGDIKGLEGEVLGWKELKPYEAQELFQELFELTGHDAKYWHSSKVIIDSMWQALLSDKYKFILSRKRVIKLVLDYWLLSEKEHDLLRQTIDISLKFSLPIVGHNIAKYVGDIELGERFLEQMPRGAFKAEDFDFGEDLFGESDEDQERKLERDIKFLLNSGKRSDVLKLTYQLEKINPQHPLVKSVLSSKTEGDNYQSNEKVEDLLVELERFSPSKESEVEVANSFKGIVKHYDQSFIQENYEDMIIGFNLINLPEVALEIIEKVATDELSERELVNLRYLSIETNLDNKNFYKARDLAEDTLATVPLVGEERLAISYLRAEAYYQLGNFTYAKQLFRSIAQKTPRYRLTEQRILRLEEN